MHRRFAGLDGVARMPDETTILRFSALPRSGKVHGAAASDVHHGQPVDGAQDAPAASVRMSAFIERQKACERAEPGLQTPISSEKSVRYCA